MTSSEHLRCAIYTRKSTDHGLDAHVTSLTAQRDVCEAYIKCQSHRRWVALPQPYDDGGYSGSTLDRPALRRLLTDIEEGRVDAIVIYKIDRLTRSLLDFVRLMEVFERFEVSFVSVTQAFDTSDSMGRLILNILLTFAQFERELMSDRVRDKKAAMLRNGYFAGGLPPFGYLVDSGGRLCLDDERGPLVREVYTRYLAGETVKGLVDDIAERQIRTRLYRSKNQRMRGGQPITTAVIRRVLENPIYTGHLVHRGEWLEAQIDPLVTREVWDTAQRVRKERAPKLDHDRNFLVNLLHDDVGRKMRMLVSGPGRKNAFRYYRSEAAVWSRATDQKTVVVRADEIECLVKSVLSGFFRDRRQLRRAVMSEAHYSQTIAGLLKKGPTCARRLDCMGPAEYRRALKALAPRIQISSAELTLYLSCGELLRFLAGHGSTSQRQAVDIGARTRVFPLTTAACLIRGHPKHTLPIVARTNANSVPQADLVSMLKSATEFRNAVFSNRDKSLAELAREHRMTQSHFARTLRLNYLAPDIQTAILDGTLPKGMSRLRLLNAAMVLDWQQQRDLLNL